MAWQLSHIRKNDKSKHAFRHRGIDYYWNPAKDSNLQWLQWWYNGKVKVVALYLDTHWERCLLTNHTGYCSVLRVIPYGESDAI